MSRSGIRWLGSQVTHGFRRSASLSPALSPFPDHARSSRAPDLSFSPHPPLPSFFFCSSLEFFFFLMTSYDVILGQGPEAAPMAVTSSDAR